MLDDKDEFESPHKDFCECDSCKYQAFSSWADRQDSYHESDPMTKWIFAAIAILIALIVFGR